jgi:ADP-ribosylglycohydrolase
MLGAIIGDIVGSPYELHNYQNEGLEPFFTRMHGLLMTLFAPLTQVCDGFID